MSQITEITCVCCPFGCRLAVEHEGEKIATVTGNRCPRGAKYAAQELVDPRRSLTTSIPIDNADIAQLPVKTSAPVKKANMLRIAAEIQKMRITAPVNCGDILLENVDGDPEIKLVATRSVPARI